MKNIKEYITKFFRTIIMPISSLTSHKLHHKIYINFLYFSYFVFFITLSGLITIDPQYINILETIIKYYVCIFLLLRFNPWTYKFIDKEEVEFDRRIAFTSGIFLFLTTTVSNLAYIYIYKIRNFLNV